MNRTYIVTIATDSLRLCESKEVEAKSSIEALLTALHHETSAYQHLRDLPMARLRITVWPAAEVLSTRDRTLNEERGCA